MLAKGLQKELEHWTGFDKQGAILTLPVTSSPASESFLQEPHTFEVLVTCTMNKSLKGCCLVANPTNDGNEGVPVVRCLPTVLLLHQWVSTQ